MYLFFVDGNAAYFSNYAARNLRGDDWNDNPYQENALPIPDGKEDMKIEKVYFDAPSSLVACDLGDFSVYDMNKRGVPWMILEGSEGRMAIGAGTFLNTFKELVRAYGGDVYVKES